MAKVGLNPMLNALSAVFIVASRGLRAFLRPPEEIQREPATDFCPRIARMNTNPVRFKIRDKFV